MRRNYSSLFLLSLLIGMTVFSGCRDKVFQSYTANIPVYQDREAWRSAQTYEFQSPRALNRAGKIYLYQDYLFINEYLQGIHVFNNSDPSNPVNLGFLPVYGNAEIAINNNVMYLDNYHDLVLFDVTDPGNPRFMSRQNDVFNFTNWGYLSDYNEDLPMAEVDPEKGVVVSWEVGETTEEVSSGFWGWGFMQADAIMPSSGFDGGGASAAIAGPGIGGSTARFTIWDNHLYTLADDILTAWDLNGGIAQRSSLNLGDGMETLFPAAGYLFIGARAGMHIYDLSNPGAPSHTADFEHAVSCDPVVVQGDYAFVTLSSGQFCGGWRDQLDVIDISNISAPNLLYTYPMTNPRGLGVDEETLFICDGPDGLKVFDKSSLHQIDANLISHFPNIEANDVIPFNNVLLMTAEEGIYQYDYSDLQNIHLLSHISVQ